VGMHLFATFGDYPYGMCASSPQQVATYFANLHSNNEPNLPLNNECDFPFNK
jgi:hypothetical protein